jgi:hypothetical protein
MASEELEKTERPTRARSGFADPKYWDTLGPKGLTRREEKRAWAKKAHEDGRFGGRQPGSGRPRNKTVAEYVAEEAAKKGDVVWRELLSMLQHKSPSVKLGAIDRINKMESDVQKNMRDDEKEIAKLGGKELQDMLLRELTGLGADIDLSDSDVEEITDVEEV